MSSLILISALVFAPKPDNVSIRMVGGCGRAEALLDFNLEGTGSAVEALAYAVNYAGVTVTEAVPGPSWADFDPDFQIVNHRPHDSCISHVAVVSFYDDTALPAVNGFRAMAISFEADAKASFSPGDCYPTLGCLVTREGHFAPNPLLLEALELDCSPGAFPVGDVNADGAVDIADAVALLGYVNGGQLLTQPMAADTNTDGRIDIGDAITILDTLFRRDHENSGSALPGNGSTGSRNAHGSAGELDSGGSR